MLDLVFRIRICLGCRTGEVESANLQRRNPSRTVTVLAHEQARFAAYHFNVRQRFDVRLGEPQIFHRVCQFSPLDHEDPVSGHAGDNAIPGVHQARVPEAADVESTVG